MLLAEFPFNNNMPKLTKNQKGQSVIEVLISLAMAGIIITAIGSSLSSIHKLNTGSAVKEKASAYAKQYMEIVTQIENNHFTNNRNDILTNSLWTDITLEQLFTPEINITKLCRDAVNGNILENCGTQVPDGKTVRITITIKYQDITKASLSTIFTNWRNQ